MLITDLTQSLTSKTGQTLSLQQVRAEAKNWQVGSLLKAFVVSNTPKEGLTLNIQGQQYRVAPQQNFDRLEVGQRLNLEVLKTGEQPLLKVVQPQAQTREAIQNDGLRRNLPIQKPLGQLLNTLENLSKQSNSKHLSQQIRDLSQRILNMLPDSGKVSTPDGLKQAVRDSGHFLENKLMQLASNPQAADKQSLQQDIKTGLLRLLQAVKSNMPPPSANPPAAKSDLQPRTDPIVYDRTSLQSRQPQSPPQAEQAARTATGSSQDGARQLAAMNKPDLPATNPSTSSQASQSTSASTQQPQANPGRPAVATGAENMATRATASPVAQDSTTHPSSASSGTIESKAAGVNMSTEQTANMATEVRKNIEAGIARIQTNQINSVRHEGGSDRPALFVEIPIRNQQNQVNVMQLQIQRDRADGGPERPPIWSISLAFDLVELGPIRAGMTLVGDKQISINLWAENPDTVELFDAEMDELREGLQNAGLLTGHIGIQQGAPSSTEILKQSPDSSQRLLDIEV